MFTIVRKGVRMLRGVAALGGVALAENGPDGGLAIPELTLDRRIADYRSQIDYRKWFQPVEVERIALAPDGGRLAYVLREENALSVTIVPLEGEGKPTVARVLETADVNRALSATRSAVLPRISWMQWVTERRLVLETNRQTTVGSTTILPTGAEGETFVVKPGSIRWMAGEIIAFNSDGSEVRRLVAPSDIAAPQTTRAGVIYVPRRPFIVGIDPDDEGAVIFAASHRPEAEIPEVVVERMRLEVASGRITSLGKKMRPERAAVLRDQQGRERLMRTGPEDRGTGECKFVHFGGVFEGAVDEDLDARAGRTTDIGFGYAAKNFWGERRMPVGFDQDPAILYYASNVGRDTWGIYGINLATGERTDEAIEDLRLDLARPLDSGFGSAGLVIDRYRGGLAGARTDVSTHWIQPLMMAVQAEIDGAIPQAENRILDWDERQAIFLVETRSRTEPGVFRVYDSEKRTLTDIVKRIRESGTQERARAIEFSCMAADGVGLDAVLTLPGSAKTARAPLVVMTPDGPFAAMPGGFDAEAQAFAGMGMATLRVNVRGAEGRGRKHREALHRGYENAQIGDLLAAMDHAAEHFPVSRRLVAVMGCEYGAYVALRAAELYPQRFRCVVAADAIVDWGRELNLNSEYAPVLAFLGEEMRTREANAWDDASAMSAAVLFLTEDFTADATTSPRGLGDMRRFASKLKAQGSVAERFNLSTAYRRLAGAEKAVAFSRIEAFFNLHLFNYTVEMGDTRVIEEKP